MDPVDQDIKRHGIEETTYNRAFEALRPIVMEDYCLFENFLMDEYPDVYNEVDDLNSIHNSFCWAAAYNNTSSMEGMWINMLDKWLEYVDKEVERRLE